MSFLRETFRWIQKTHVLNTLFTPSFLLYTASVVVFSALYLDFGQGIKNRWDAYAYVLVLNAILIFLRSFVITFSNLRVHSRKHRGMAIGFDALLFAAVVYLASLALNFSRETADPLQFFVIFAISSAIFYVQLFLSQTQPLLKATFLNFAFYVFGTVLFYGIVRSNDFGIDIDLRTRTLMVNGMVFATAFLEACLFFQAMRHFFSQNTEGADV